MSRSTIVTLDTNVLISGFLNPFGPPGRILDDLLTRRLHIAHDDRVLVEYREVLGRPEFGFSRSHIQRFLDIMPFQARVFPSPWRHPHPPDPDDLLFLEVADASTHLLITEYLRHFPPRCRGQVRVLSPREWVSRDGLAG